MAIGDLDCRVLRTEDRTEATPIEDSYIDVLLKRS